MSSVKEALLRHHNRLLQKQAKPKRRNKSPEKETEKECLAWMRQNNWDVNVVEGRGGMNQYGAVTVTGGFSDVCGNTPTGLAVFIELKAQGKCRTLRLNQRSFLTKKIQSNAFAVCVDSADHLARLWDGFMEIRRSKDLDACQQFLMDALPAEPKSRTDREHPELGF